MFPKSFFPDGFFPPNFYEKPEEKPKPKGKGKGVGGKHNYAAAIIQYMMEEEARRNLLDEASKMESLKVMTRLRQERNLAQETKIIAERQSRIIASVATILAEV